MSRCADFGQNIHCAIEYLRPDMCALLLDVSADKYCRSNAGL